MSTPEYVNKEYAEGGDACMTALASNWDGILAGAILEIIQWSYEFINKIFYAFWVVWAQVPFLGLWPIWWSWMFRNSATDNSRTYAHGI